LALPTLSLCKNLKLKKNAIGSKPCFIISGSDFDNDEVLKMTANIFVDFFRGSVIDNINLSGIDHVIALTAKNSTSFHFRHYSVHMKKSEDRVPKVELEEIGPSIDFAIRRNKFAVGDLRKQTLAPKKKKKKHIKTNELKEYVSNVHIPNQKIEDVNKTVKRTKALKRKWMDGTVKDIDTDIEEETNVTTEEVEQPQKKKKRKLNNEE